MLLINVCRFLSICKPPLVEAFRFVLPLASVSLAKNKRIHCAQQKEQNPQKVLLF